MSGRIRCLGFLFLASVLSGGARTAESSDHATVRYHVSIENTWSEVTHPGLFPEAAHFSWLGGGTHNDQTSYWNVGEVASDEIVQMAETGVIKRLVEQIDADPDAYSVIDLRHWFCPDEIDVKSCGPTSFSFDAHRDFPFLTLTTMLGPSPDWFVGVSSLPLLEGDAWVEQIELELYPYDAGTRSDNVFELFGTLTDPPEPIQLITEESGQIITPQSLGTMTLTRLDTCDLTGDFACNAADIDLLSDQIRSGEFGFDLNGDGATDLADRTHWVEHLMLTQYGDGNLDRVVDFDDFLSLAREFGTIGGWADGDYDGSGMSDFSDFLMLAQSFGSGGSVQAVPEPHNGAGWLCLMMLPLRYFFFRRRQR